MPSPTDVQKALSGMDYPADKKDLVEHAKNNGADDQIIDNLQKIPDKRYDGPDQVQKEVF
jgi:hypothetical protein